MCRGWAVAEAPAPASLDGAGQGGAAASPDEWVDPGFNWFDAIDDICCEAPHGAPGPPPSSEDPSADAGEEAWMARPDAELVQQLQGLQGLHAGQLFAPIGLPAAPAAGGRSLSSHLSESDGSALEPAPGDGRPRCAAVKEDDQDRPRGTHMSTRKMPRVRYSEHAADKIERVKQKRRESAQRSRARKNAYMKDLEEDNAALRDQVAELQRMVAELQTSLSAAATASCANLLVC